MTVPLGYDNLARRMDYIYDSSGRLVGMNVEETTATSGTTLAANAGSGDETKFYYNTDQNRVKFLVCQGTTRSIQWKTQCITTNVVSERI